MGSKQGTLARLCSLPKPAHTQKSTVYFGQECEATAEVGHHFLGTPFCTDSCPCCPRPSCSPNLGPGVHFLPRVGERRKRRERERERERKREIIDRKETGEQKEETKGKAAGRKKK